MKFTIAPSGRAGAVCACGLALLAAGAARSASSRALPPASAEQRSTNCAGTPRTGLTPSPHVYCIKLHATPNLRGASAAAEMVPAPSPFGIAVDPDGHHRYRLTVTASLPDPASLGPYATFVAWVTTPLLTGMTKLGEVRSGSNELGEVTLDKFLILITAEQSATVEERQGRLVLRGMSPSSLQSDHSMMAPPSAADAEHRHHAVRGEDTNNTRWFMPPMDSSIPMVMGGLETLVPAATPFLPGRGVAAEAIRDAVPRRVVDLEDGDTLNLEALLVKRTIKGQTLIMYGYNGEYPGPLIRVKQDASIAVNFTNRTELPSTIHWHGVRLENRFDGVPGVTQDPVKPGQTFQYRVHFRDAGIYWYHPHHREDIAQDLGLYGNILVSATRPDYQGPVNRDEVLMLDDLLLGEQGLVPYGQETPTHALMGRFGNVMLVNGEPEYELSVKTGEVVRFYLTNVSNVRTYNLSFGGARTKVIASDLGRLRREQWVQSVVIAPAERYVVDVRFDTAGAMALTNRVQAINHTFGYFFPQVDTLGRIRVTTDHAHPDHSTAFAQLRTNADVVDDIERYRSYFDRPPQRELLATLDARAVPAAVMRFLRLETYFNPVEWSGTMPMMDWLATGREVEWILRDPATGKQNMNMDWRFRQGDVVKIRVGNDRGTPHSMQHTIHIHGQRFLVLAENGVPNQDLVWKDTVLLPVGATVDLLLELSNPGRWMLHCHIPEHMESGMHMLFTVDSTGVGR